MADFTGKTPSDAVKKRAKAVEDHRWSANMLRYGEDLSKLDSKTVKRFCKRHGGRTGYTLNLKPVEVGVNVSQ